MLAAVSSPAAAAPGELNIGFVGTLTGAQAHVAQDQLDGFQLAIKHLGGRLGGMEFNLSVLDDHHDGETARQETRRLLQGDRIQLLMVSTDPPTEASLVPLAVATKTLVVSLNAPTSAQAGKECSPHLFSLAGLADTMQEMAGQHLQAQGYHTVVLVHREGAGDADAIAALRRGFKGQLVEVATRRGEMDFDATLRSIRQAAPDAVYLLESGGMAVNFILQYASAGLKKDLPLLGPATTFDQGVIAAAGPAALGALSVGPWSDDLDAPANRRMMADFEGEYGRPASLFAAEGYDAAMLLDSAVRAADKRFNDEDALRTALRRGDFPTTRGSFRFDTNQFPIQSYLTRQVVQDPREHMVNEQHGIFARDVRDGHAGECPMRWVVEPPPKG